MYSLSAELQPLHPKSDGTAHEVMLQVVDGTLSSAKTTPIEAYVAGRPQIGDSDLDLPRKRVQSFIHRDETVPRMHPYEFRCVTETIDGVVVPIIVIPETARMYADSVHDRNVLTTDYTAQDQMAITVRQSFRFGDAVLKAAVMARKLQPGRQRTVSGVLSDRGPMAGFAFGYTRLPDEDHIHGDLRDFLYTNSDKAVPIDVLADAVETTRHIDRLLLTTSDEVDLEEDGQRLLDPEFRRHIAQEIAWMYSWAFKDDSTRIGELSGSPIRRRLTIRQELRSLLARQLLAQEQSAVNA